MAKQQKSHEKHRLQLDFSAEAYKRLLRLREEVEASSNAEVIRLALRLLEWVLEQQSEDYQVFVAQGDDMKNVKQIELLVGIPRQRSAELKSYQELEDDG